MELAGCGGNMLVNILDADATNEELLNQLYLQNNTAFANLYADLYNMYGTPPIPAFNLMGAISFIRNNVANNEQVINMLGGYFSPSEIEAAAMQLSQGLVQSALPFGSFVQLLNCMLASDLCTAIANNYPDLAHLRDLLMQYADPGYMLGLALQNDPNFIKTTSQNQSYLVAEALRMLEDMSVESYLRKVEQGYGGSVLSQLLEALSEELTFTKKFVLADHHLYGSSRLGVKEPRRVLLQKEYTIAGFEENGEIIIDEVIDSFVYVPNNAYFYRMLAQKQYELTNHLGNVLATVLDRRIAVFDQSSGNLTHYQADIITATQFYPFGSVLSGVYKGEYRYGFNGKETDSETDLQDYGFRIYNPSYGKFLSVDPLHREYPFYTPYQFAGNMPICAADLDGLEPDFKHIRLPKRSYLDKYLANDGYISKNMSNSQKVEELKKRVTSYDGFYVSFDKSTGETMMQKVETIISKVDEKSIKVEFENRLTTYFLDKSGNILSDKTTSTSQDRYIQVNTIKSKSGEIFEEIGLSKESGKKHELFLGANKFDDENGFVSLFSDFVKLNSKLIYNEKMTPEMEQNSKRVSAIFSFILSRAGIKVPGSGNLIVESVVSNSRGFVNAHISKDNLTDFIGFIENKNDKAVSDKSNK
jgi:RHS repeat-associated protein